MKLLSEDSPQYLKRLVKAINKEDVVYLGGDLECYRVKKVSYWKIGNKLIVRLFNGKKRVGLFKFFDGNGQEIVGNRIL